MKSRSNFGLFLGRWILLGCLLLVVLVTGQEVFTDDQLEAMTDEDLEQICMVRGFELVKNDVDPNTGEIYKLTHGDFVEAAQRCLAIEEEMNELLEEYPELAEELEEEIKKMETEQAQKQAEVEELQNKISAAEESSVEASGFSAGAAFVSTPKKAEDDAEKSESSSGAAFVSTPQPDHDDEEDDFEISEDEPALESQSGEATIQEEEIVKVSETVQESQTTGDMASSEESAKEKDDFTMRVLAVEIIRGLVRHAENDLKRIVELMAPVVTPMLRAGNVAWKHVRALIVTLKHNYDASKGSATHEEAEGREEAPTLA